MTTARWLPAACLLLLALASAGCGDDSAGCGCTYPPLPATVETPQAAMARFETTYESQNLTGYSKLFTSDFRFHFSAAADPTLVSQYGNTWDSAFETNAAGHLFDGFTSERSDYNPGADLIALTLAAVRYESDPEHADSTRHYVVADSAQIALAITLASGAGEYDVAGTHSFWLVRGDAARLGAGQAPDSTRWFIRRWDDLTAPLTVRTGRPTKPARVLPAQNTTWGRVKAQYLQ